MPTATDEVQEKSAWGLNQSQVDDLLAAKEESTNHSLQIGSFVTVRVIDDLQGGRLEGEPSFTVTKGRLQSDNGVLLSVKDSKGVIIDFEYSMFYDVTDLAGNYTEGGAYFDWGAGHNYEVIPENAKPQSDVTMYLVGAAFLAGLYFFKK